MMDSVRDLEPKRAMHQPVCPIKPCVVRKQIQQYRQRQMPEWISANITVNHRPAEIIPSPSDNPRRNAVNRGTGEAPPDFAADLLVKAEIKPRFAQFRRPCKSTADDQIAHADNRRHRQC